MKPKHLTVVSLGLLLMLTVGCPELNLDQLAGLFGGIIEVPMLDEDAVEVGVDDDGGAVTLEAGGVLVVTLPDHCVDCGNRWKVAEVDTSIVDMAGYGLVSDCAEPDTDGCTGSEVFTFDVESAGTTTLRLENGQWVEFGAAEDSDPVDTFEITVTVIDGT